LQSLCGRPVMGILGMDCLRHYCIQLDFDARKMRFLARDPADAAPPGDSFPLTFDHGTPSIQRPALLRGTNTSLLIDVGNAHDGDLPTQFFRREIEEHKLRAEADKVDEGPPGKALLLACVWNGHSYTNLLIGHGVNSIGLRFLARHLVTFDFPNRTMYLKQTTGDPLFAERTVSAAEFLKDLKEDGHAPGWSKDDDGKIELELCPNSETFDFRKDGPLSACHYRITRVSGDGPWKLQKAWRTDQNDHTIEEYPVP